MTDTRTLALAVLRHLVSQAREAGVLEEQAEAVLTELAEYGDDAQPYDATALDLAIDTLLEY